MEQSQQQPQQRADPAGNQTPDPARKIVFNSSLPRSGSTLLQNILAQNPRFYCSPTSGVITLLEAARLTFVDGPPFMAQDPAVMQAGFRAFCRAALEGFY